MKNRISLIVVCSDGRYSQTDPRRLSILLDDMRPPTKYIVGDLDENIKGLFAKYLNVKYEWVSLNLCGFRELNREYETCYICHFPYITNCIKQGKLYSLAELTNSEQKMDDYYGRLISRR